MQQESSVSDLNITTFEKIFDEVFLHIATKLSQDCNHYKTDPLRALPAFATVVILVQMNYFANIPMSVNKNSVPLPLVFDNSHDGVVILSPGCSDGFANRGVPLPLVADTKTGKTVLSSCRQVAATASQPAASKSLRVVASILKLIKVIKKMKVGNLSDPTSDVRFAKIESIYLSYNIGSLTYKMFVIR